MYAVIFVLIVTKGSLIFFELFKNALIIEQLLEYQNVKMFNVIKHFIINP